ncbi:MAG: tRNA (adenine37-N6)-methyltransferase [Thermoproteota archaeon]|nr:tRNA (adenine37-N6)-methyltransferase [Thermoproteota archaeon]
MENEAKLKFIGSVEENDDLVAKIRIFPEFCEALFGLNNFSHVIILYWLHHRDNEENRRTLKVTPRHHLGAPETGVFACRSPSRPNPIGLCVSEIMKVEGCILVLKELDVDAETPIIDIKPYIPRADSVPEAKVPEWTSHGPKT